MPRINLTKIATPAAPPANYLDILYSSSLTPNVPIAIDESGNVLRLGGLSIRDYRFIQRVEITTAPQDYTPNVNATALLVECWGAGGGGGGCATAITNGAAAGGGGGGAYSLKWNTMNVQGTRSVTRGTFGAGGALGANNGGAGGDAIFNDSTGAPICVAKGGSGGLADTVALGPRIGGLGGAGGLASSGIGDIKVDGKMGKCGIVLAAAQVLQGRGASGMWGIGGANALKNQTAAGTAAGSFAVGAGGAGASIISGGASQAGGAGSLGYIIIWEFC